MAVDEGSLLGLFRYQNGNISVVANGLTRMPGSTNNFYSFVEADISGEDVAFSPAQSPP